MEWEQKFPLITDLPVILTIFLIIFWETTFEFNLSFFTPFTLADKTDPYNPENRLPTIVPSIICALFPFGSASLFFNCLIIHLQALIYPPLSALYVRPSCETFSWISNELVAYEVLLAGRAPIYGRVCLLFININPLGKQCPYAIFSRALSGTSLGSKSHCFSLDSRWLLGRTHKIRFVSLTAVCVTFGVVCCS